MSRCLPATAGRDLTIADGSQVHGAVTAATRAAATAGLGPKDTARCQLLATELATNLVKHAREGRLLVGVTGPGAVQLVSVDRGPGISDVPASMIDGYTTTSSLGGGLGACRRAAAEFDLYSRAGRGTVVLARVGPAAAWQPPAAVVGGVLTAHPAESVSGDGYALVWDGDRMTIGVVDGLGHGPRAAAAREEALEIIGRCSVSDVPRLLEKLDAGLRGTRGAAAAIVRVDGWARRMAFAGVGNVNGRLLRPEGQDTFLSEPGILGTGIAHRSCLFGSADWAPPATVVVHTDGINSRWSADDYPGAGRHHPAVLAALIWRDAVRGTDDAGIVVLRAPTDEDGRWRT